MADIASSLSIKGEISHQSVENYSTPEQKTSSQVISISLTLDLVVKLTKPILFLGSLFCPKKPSPEDHPDTPHSEPHTEPHTETHCSDHHKFSPCPDQNSPAAMSSLINNECKDRTMTGIAAILNPLGRNEVLEFYTTAYRNLGMLTLDAFNSADVHELQEYKDPPAKGSGEWELGPLLPGTPLVVLKFKNQIRVYGISKYYNKDGNLILSVSPSIASVGIATSVDAFAGTGDGKSKGWLYELEDGELGREVKEYPLKTDGSKVGDGSPVTPDGMGKGSRISAFYHNKGNTRYVVYQGDNFTLKWQPLGGDQAYNDAVTFAASTSMDNNTLQTWTTHAACALEDTAFIFYVGSRTLSYQGRQQQVNKLYLLKTDINSNGRGKPEDLKKDVLPNGALSVVPVVNDDGEWDIIVFCMARGDGPKDRRLSKHVYSTGIKAAGKA
ncbi:hypothetical protein TWF718_005750 [Orbilia javanica]|uniref:Uncharacterized protein n=1 Tax=Orbilia javanica TaxID=47235 RepID=A0AAN8N1G0_9PEZI